MLEGKSILTPIQRQCLDVFARLPDQERFYLTGGTALAEFYLAHRLSFDLDFFTDEERLILPFSYALEHAYSRQGWQVSITQRFATFVAFDPTELKQSFQAMALAIMDRLSSQ